MSAMMVSEPLNARQTAFVAAYLGVARFNATKAALLAGYSEKTAHAIGSNLLKKVEIQAAVQAWRDAVRSRGVANLEYRLAGLDELERRCWEVIAERADEVGRDPKAAGGKTGLVTKQHRIIGVGGDVKVLTEHAVDTALIREIRALHEQAAKELGGWTDRVEQTGGVTVRIIGVDPEAL